MYCVFAVGVGHDTTEEATLPWQRVNNGHQYQAPLSLVTEDMYPTLDAEVSVICSAGQL